jgi:arylsulfatase A-like enzyme
VNAPFVQARYGFARGFDRFEEADAIKHSAGYQRRVEALLAGLEPPFFAFLHYMSVHSPYIPPPEFDLFTRKDDPPVGVDGGRIRELSEQIRLGKRRLSEAERYHMVARYDGEILALDHVLQGTFDAVARRWPGQAFVVVTSDHGEEFLEHGQIAHGRTLYDEVLHVPLIVQGPGLAAGRRVGEPVSLLDLVPTLLELVGAEPASGVEGRSLAAAARGGAGPGGAFFLPLQTSHHDNAVQLRGVRTATQKLIADDHTGERALYDLETDPGERLAQPVVPAAARLYRVLEALRPLPSAAVAARGKEVEEQLRALGYH